MRDTAEISLVNGSVLAFVTVADIETALKIALLILSILYTAYKFYLTHKNSKASDE